MIIQVSELPKEGLTFDDVESFGSAYTDRTWHLDTVRLTLTPDGHDVAVDGQIEATIPQICSRCLESFPSKVAASVAVHVIPRPAIGGDSNELGRDDLDTDFYVNDQLDLDRLIEAETTLALPMKPLCRTDCRGLCPVCGANRNVTPCACEVRQPDPRLAALKQFTTRSDN